MPNRAHKSKIEAADFKLISSKYMDKDSPSISGDGDGICDLCGKVSCPKFNTNVEFRQDYDLHLMCDECYGKLKFMQAREVQE